MGKFKSTQYLSKYSIAYQTYISIAKEAPERQPLFSFILRTFEKSK